MKILIVLVALVAVAYGKVSLEAVFKAQWSSFKASHGKSYSPEEEPKRLQNFMSNALMVAMHNERFANGEVTYELGHNEFSDMDHEEFKQTRCGYKAPEGLQASNDNVTVFTASPNAITAARIDWSSTTRSVRNQGSCGSCYSFSALAAVEGALFRKYQVQYDLSEQNIVDCSTGYGNGGCGGGHMTSSFQYIMDNRGVNQEYSYPYEGRLAQCRFQASNGAIGIRSYCRVAPGEAALEQALNTIGPISVAIDANPRSLMMYKGGIYNDASCTTSLNHAVTAVGYGQDQYGSYWIVKNSWGTSWGEGGFIRIAKGGNRCGIANDCSYPLV